MSDYTHAVLQKQIYKVRNMTVDKNIPLDHQYLTDLVTTKMPFGKYEGKLICDLPEFYLVWFRQKGFPKGKIGILLETMYEIRLNGLEYLLHPLRKRS